MYSFGPRGERFNNRMRVKSDVKSLSSHKLCLHITVNKIFTQWWTSCCCRREGGHREGREFKLHWPRVSEIHHHVMSSSVICGSTSPLKPYGLLDIHFWTPLALIRTPCFYFGSNFKTCRHKPVEAGITLLCLVWWGCSVTADLATQIIAN